MGERLLTETDEVVIGIFLNTQKVSREKNKNRGQINLDGDVQLSLWFLSDVVQWGDILGLQLQDPLRSNKTIKGRHVKGHVKLFEYLNKGVSLEEQLVSHSHFTGIHTRPHGICEEANSLRVTQTEKQTKGECIP